MPDWKRLFHIQQNAASVRLQPKPWRLRITCTCNHVGIMCHAASKLRWRGIPCEADADGRAAQERLRLYSRIHAAVAECQGVPFLCRYVENDHQCANNMKVLGIRRLRLDE